MRERERGHTWGRVVGGASGSALGRGPPGGAGGGGVGRGPDGSPQHTRPLIGVQLRIKNLKRVETDAQLNTTSDKKKYASA
jgi:hypothetical protein